MTFFLFLFKYFVSFFQSSINRLNKGIIITNEDIKKIMKITGVNESNIKIRDMGYFAVNKEIIELLKNLNVFRKLDYSKTHDCDNFSSEFSGLCSLVAPNYSIGECWVHTPTGNHALNCFIDDNKRLLLFEPQNNNVFEPQTKKYKPYFVMI